jgi:acyl-CoA synthetase (NDP forming)
MASNIRVFNAACRQAGIILARQPMDLLDLSAAFSSLPLPRGKRVALITLGGGWGVVATDQCAESGLEITPLSSDIISRIDEILPAYWSRGNPVDLVGELNFDVATKVVGMLAEWDGCDAIIHLGIEGVESLLENFGKSCIKLQPALQGPLAQRRLDMMKLEGLYIDHTIRLMEKYRKPILGVRLLDGNGKQAVRDMAGSEFKAVSFPTPERAVNALAGMVRYAKWLEREGVQK